jgi:hypothetical protein
MALRSTKVFSSFSFDKEYSGSSYGT